MFSHAGVETTQSPAEVAAEAINEERRALLARSTIMLGVVGIAMASVPLVASWQPSERARAMGRSTSIGAGRLMPGEMLVAMWRRKPIVIVHRTRAMLAQLGRHDGQLKDPHSSQSDQPEYARNSMRSRQANLFVAVGICTHLGCLPKARLQPGSPSMGEDWPGGFYCPCHGSRFDLAGRVFKGSPASRNLDIPPYQISRTTDIVVGTVERGA